MSFDLTPDLRRRFDDDGFVALPQFFTAREMNRLLAEVDRYIQNVVPSLPAEEAFYEQKGESRSLKQIHRMNEHDTWFGQQLETGPLRAVAEFVLGRPVVPRNLQYFNKPPGIGAPTPPHQDGFYFMLEPSEAVTLWLALDRVDEENGCVRYIPGSHRRGMRPHHRTQTLGFSQGIADFPQPREEAAEIAVPAEPGDLLVHHALTIHRADGNRSSTRTRRALGLVYYSDRAREDAEAHAAYQRQLTADLKTAGKI